MQTAPQIPPHLPRKLAISFWLWNYYGAAGEGEPFHDLERRIVELKERGFNTIRLDAGIGLCYTADGEPRGEVELKEAFPGHGSLIRQINPGDGRCNVLEKVIELFELARKHDVYVIMSSWFYLHTFWFASDQIAAEMFRLPVEERLMYMAVEHSRLIGRLRQKGLHTQIAFVEITNECDGADYTFFREASPGSEVDQRHRFRQLHEEALAFLRDRHPDLLFACDTCHSSIPVDFLPRNMQVWNHHMYYLWPLYTRSFEDGLYGPDFDFANPQKCPATSRFLRADPTTIESVRASTGNNRNIHDTWYRRVWLYSNIDPAMLGELDAWFAELLDRDAAEYRQAAEAGIERAVRTRDENFAGLPLVLGEAVSYCAHLGLRWEERSEQYWALLEHTTRVVKRAGYWGYVVRTHSGPEDPAWTECPDRFRTLNALFLGE